MKFSQKMPLYLIYTIMQKSQRWPKTQTKGRPALKEKSEVTKTLPQSELDSRSLAQESSVYPPELSVSWWMQVEKIHQTISAATDCTSTVVASAGKAQTRSFGFALFKYTYNNIHLALMNTGWYLAHEVALIAHSWPRQYLPRLRLGKYVDSVNRTHLGPYGTR